MKTNETNDICYTEDGNHTVSRSSRRSNLSPVKSVIQKIGQKVKSLFHAPFSKDCLLNAVPAQIAVLDYDGTITAVNDAWINFRQAANFKGRLCTVGDNYITFSYNVPAEYATIAEAMTKGITEVLQGRRSEFSYEYACPTSATKTWFLARVAPVYMGKKRGAAVMHFNITDSKLAQEKTRNSEANLHAIIENTGASVYSIDTGFRFITFNRALHDSMKDYFGMDVKPGDHAFEFLEKQYPTEARIWKDIYSEALTGKSLSFEKDYTRPGKPLYVSFSINPIWEDKRVIGLSCQARDITRKKIAEDEFRASEKRFRHISQNPIVGITWNSPDGKILNANEAFYNMLGYNHTELIDKHFSVFTHPDDVPLQQQLNDQLLNGMSMSGALEKRYIKKNGEELWGKAFLSAIKNDQGKVKYIIGVMHDISAAKRLEAELVSLNESLEQKIKERTAELQFANRELESFSYTVSHDLQAPLRVVSGYSSLMLKGYAGKLDESGMEQLRTINKMVHRMSQLVKDLLAFSKGGHTTIIKSEVDMHDLVRLVIDEVKIITPHTNYQLQVHNLSPAFCDRGLITQVWSNLILNAVKYSRNKEQALIEIGSKQIEGCETYYVKDNGTGFDMKDAGKLFGAFQRLHVQTEFEGTGVGLATVHRIITGHGGRIWAEAKVNEGATFYFTIPPRAIPGPEQTPSPR